MKVCHYVTVKHTPSGEVAQCMWYCRTKHQAVEKTTELLDKDWIVIEKM